VQNESTEQRRRGGRNARTWSRPQTRRPRATRPPLCLSRLVPRAVVGVCSFFVHGTHSENYNARIMCHQLARWPGEWQSFSWSLHPQQSHPAGPARSARLARIRLLYLVTISSTKPRFRSRWISWFYISASSALLPSRTHIVASSFRPALLLAHCSPCPGNCRENLRISRHSLRHNTPVILFLTIPARVCASPAACILNGSFAMSNALSSFNPICLHQNTTAARGWWYCL
jgi:hypothetical protein